MPGAKLILYPDANHGAWHENHEDFVFETNRFLDDREKEMGMATKEIKVRRFSVTSSKDFRDVVAALGTVIGRPDMRLFGKSMGQAKTFADVEEIVREAIGPSELMEFMRLDLGDVLGKRKGGAAKQSLRFLVGNPVIMTAMVEHVPDAGSYAPVTILVDERADGVHLSYDRMESFLASYGSPEALKVAQDLDSKVEAVLMAAAG
jgi:hypothetical protein